MRNGNQIGAELKKQGVVAMIENGKDGMGLCFIKDNITYRVIASWGAGWDHVSVSLVDRCPTWEEMCWIKDLFFEPEECVMQLHPPKSRYVNCHPYCLHLWKPHRHTIPLPPTEFVGVK